MQADELLRLRDLRSRKDFFRVAGLTTMGASAALLAACGGDDENQGSAAQPTGRGQGDVMILNAALDLEMTAIAAYTVGATVLKGDALAVGRQFLDHEQEHADGLSQAIRDLGGTPNKAKSAEEYAQGFPSLENQREVIEFAIDVENMGIAAYIDAIPKLSSGEMRQTAAAIVSNEAEHLSVLIGLLEPRDAEARVPDAFVTGKRA